MSGESIELFEGMELGWTVIFEPQPGQSFKVSPGFRTVYVTGVLAEPNVLAGLAVASKWIEAIAVAGCPCNGLPGRRDSGYREG